MGKCFLCHQDMNSDETIEKGVLRFPVCNRDHENKLKYIDELEDLSRSSVKQRGYIKSMLRKNPHVKDQLPS